MYEAFVSRCFRRLHALCCSFAGSSLCGSKIYPTIFLSIVFGAMPALVLVEGPCVYYRTSQRPEQKSRWAARRLAKTARQSNQAKTLAASRCARPPARESDRRATRHPRRRSDRTSDPSGAPCAST